MSGIPNSAAAVTWRPGDDVWLESQNYFMRTLTAADATDQVLAWWADPAVMVPMGEIARAYTREEARTYIGKFDNVQSFLLGIFVKETGLHIGWRSIEYVKKTKSAVTHLAIGDESYRGRGVNFELQDAVYHFMFYTFRTEKMAATMYADNGRMRRRAERAGYRSRGLITKRHLGSDGKMRDVLLFEMTERDWRARRKWVCSPTWRAGYRVAA